MLQFKEYFSAFHSDYYCVSLGFFFINFFSSLTVFSESLTIRFMPLKYRCCGITASSLKVKKFLTVIPVRKLPRLCKHLIMRLLVSFIILLYFPKIYKLCIFSSFFFNCFGYCEVVLFR